MTAGRLRPGYKEIVAPGEYVSFDLAFRDSAPRPSPQVFLTDTPTRMSDADRSRALAAGRYSEVRDAARSDYIDRLTGSPNAPAPTTDDAARVQRDDARTRYIRDQLRVSRYEG
ncbi:hypothetical protein ABC955_10325 [Citromicrobium bathyomarinum]